MKRRWSAPFSRLLVILATTVGLSVSLAPATASAATDPNALGVMTWNIAAGSCATKPDDAKHKITPYELGSLTGEIKARFKTGIDVFVLQEVFKDQAEFIADQGLNLAPSTHVQMVTTKTCSPLDDAGTPLGPRGNAIISRYPIANGFSYTLPHQDPADGDQRGMAGGSILVNGKRVWIFGTHLTASGPADNQSAPIRAAQAADVRDRAEAENSAPFRSIVAGDFNDRPINSIGHAYAAMSALYVDEWREAHPDIADGPDSVGNTDPGLHKRIDYIWRRKGSQLSLTSTSVLTPTFYTRSDHLGLSSRFIVTAA